MWSRKDKKEFWVGGGQREKAQRKGVGTDS